jgi:hypothetical protein
MSRWVIIGLEGDNFAERSESLLRRMESYAVRRRGGNIEFALRYSLLKNESLLQFSRRIGSDDSYDIINIDDILASPGVHEIDQWQADLSDIPKTAKVLDQFKDIQRFERFNRVLFYTGVRQLPYVLRQLIAPKFFEW